MTLLEDDILQALRTVEDPDLKRDLVTLGMIQDLVVKEQEVYFTLALTTPACPLQEVIKKACVAAIHGYVSPTLVVHIHLVAQVTSSRPATAILPQVKNIIAIASGKGGVGKSTIAVNIAVALARHGAKVGLLDADIFGPSIPTMLGCEGARPQVMEKDGKKHLIPLEKYGIKLLSMGLLAPADDAMVWRGPMASKALRQLLGDTDWGDLDYLFVDLPPGTSDLHLTLVQVVSVTGAVIVTTPQKIALIDARKGIAMFQKALVNVPILGVVENMAYYSPEASLSVQYYPFGQEGGRALAAQQEVPFLGQVPFIHLIREGSDKGLPAVLHPGGPAAFFLDNVATAVAQQIAMQNAQLTAGA